MSSGRLVVPDGGYLTGTTAQVQLVEIDDVLGKRISDSRARTRETRRRRDRPRKLAALIVRAAEILLLDWRPTMDTRQLAVSAKGTVGSAVP